MPRTNETRCIEWHETCKCECKFGAKVCNNNVGIKINADVNVNNLLMKECVIRDLFGILVIVNMIKHVILVNI